MNRRIGERLRKLATDHARAAERIREEEEALEAATVELVRSEEARTLLQDVAEEVQKQAHQRIAAVVSRCLQDVFGDGAYEFRVDFAKKRGRTEAALAFVRNGETVDPLSAAGGGVVDVAAFALRLACLVLHRPPLRKFLAIDEGFKHVSQSYRPRVRELLEALAEEMGVQIVQITHDPALVTGHVVEV